MDFTRLTRYLDTLKEAYGVCGLDCKIMRKHNTVFRHTAGYSDYALQTPVSDRDLYEVYSCTKIITMIAVMQLAEQGKIGLYDKLEQILPEFSEMQVATDFQLGEWPFQWPTSKSPLTPAKNKILIHNLMSMTAGLSYDSFSEQILASKKESGNQATTRQMMKAIARMPLIFEPGTRYSYSLAHDVLGGVIEAVSGMPYGSYLKQYIFDPLGITDMYIQIPECESHRLTAQYRKNMETGIIEPSSGMIHRLTERYESGGAGLACSVDAYSMVIDALANGGIGANGNRILMQESIQMMSKNWLNEQQMKDFSSAGKVGYSYGLGVRTLINRDCSKSPFGEFGWDGAAGAYALIDPMNHLSIFYAHEILGMITAYSEIHPTIRDLTYEAMGLS